MNAYSKLTMRSPCMKCLILSTRATLSNSHRSSASVKEARISLKSAQASNPVAPCLRKPLHDLIAIPWVLMTILSRMTTLGLKVLSMALMATLMTTNASSAKLSRTLFNLRYLEVRNFGSSDGTGTWTYVFGSAPLLHKGYGYCHAYLHWTLHW